MSNKKLIKGGIVVTADGEQRADVLVVGEKIAAVALDLDEAGLHPGVAFPAFFEIEGDPEKTPDGKFKARTTLGRAGSLHEPVWLRITR